MQHAGLRQRRLAQQRQGIGPRFTGVDDHRLAGDPRRFEVQAEGLLLQFGRLRLVVVVQACLADGHHPGVLQFAEQPVQGRSGAGLEIQRMDAHRAIHVLVAFGECLDGGSVVGTHADAEEVADAAGARGVQCSIQGAAMSRQVQAIKVAM
ncbi:hypothetical protein D9M70_422710 [compost metagenome]